ncbi:MAG: hypothetical protein DRP58_11000 [Spirochaetes bacterium]|nr:MAG: hypothetical protein DRP58_11000 [Spirochaetota bacterium]
MPTFFYTAKSFKGRFKSGTKEAKDRHQLARALRSQGYILISASLEEEKNRRKGIRISFGVSFTEKMMFVRNLRAMVSAGISLPRALQALASQAKSKKFKYVLTNIREEIVKGKSFSESLEKYPRVFSKLFVNMIKVGEEAGTLEEVLRILGSQMEKEYQLKSKIKGAMIYPAVIISAMILIGIAMLIMVVPKIAETFKELNVELPATTQLVIGSGSFLAKNWFFVVLIIIGLFIVGQLILRTKTGKRMFDFFVLKLPIVSPIIKKSNSAATARTLSSLISSGVPIVRSLEILSGTLGNVYYKSAIEDAVERVKKGDKLSQVLSAYQDIYPLVVIQMVEVGEETGQTSDILAKLADFFEEEVSNATKNLSAVIEPILMVIIGAVVGFFAISMIQPMYSMLGSM